MAKGAVELIVLALGAVAVIAAVVLFGVLPDRPVPTRQFVVTFADDAVDGVAQETQLIEGTPATLTFPVAAGNLSYIELTLAFTDDVAASDPDLVRIEIRDPEGKGRPPAVESANLLPAARTGGPTPAYDAIERIVTIVIAVNDRPSTQVVAAVDGRETPEQAAHRVAPLFSAAGSGTWSVQATIAAGDCPAADLDPQRAAVCRSGTPGGADTGNGLRIVQFRSFHWRAELVRA